MFSLYVVSSIPLRYVVSKDLWYFGIMFVVSFCELAKTLKVNGSNVQEFVTFMKVNVFLFYLLCVYHNLRVVFLIYRI